MGFTLSARPYFGNLLAPAQLSRHAGRQYKITSPNKTVHNYVHLQRESLLAHVSVICSILVVPKRVFRGVRVRRVVGLPEEAVPEEGQQLLNSYHLQGSGEEHGNMKQASLYKSPLHKG